MDHTQKAAMKLLLVAVGAGVVAFVVPLILNLTSKGVLFCYAMAFVCPGLTIAAIFMLANGDRSDALFGPLGSEQRGRTVQRYGLLLAIPGLALCVLLYFVLDRHGYRAPWDIGQHYPDMR